MKIKSLATLSLVLLSTIKAFAQQPDYSGSWGLNTQKSDFGGVPLFVMFNRITIGLKKDSIYLNGTTVDQNGNPTPAAATNYSLDGKPSERLFQDTMKIASSCQWSADKKAIVKTQSYTSINHPEQPLIKIKETWRLSDDGRELIIERNFQSLNSRQVSYKINAIFDRQ
jgi:hypothetical protein